MKKRILIADLKDPEMQLLKQELGKRFETEETSNYNDTISLLSMQKDTFGTLVVNYDLLHQDNGALSRLMQSDDILQKIPTICIHSHPADISEQNSSHHTALAHGALGYFTTPLDIPLICQYIENVICFMGYEREATLIEQLQVIIQNYHDGITISHDAFDTLNYYYANERFFAMFGYTMQEFEEEGFTSIYDLILPQFVTAVKTAFYKAETQMNTEQVMFMATKKDGTTIWIRSRNTVHYVNSQERTAYVSFYEDISNLLQYIYG